MPHRDLEQSKEGVLGEDSGELRAQNAQGHVITWSLAFVLS